MSRIVVRPNGTIRMLYDDSLRGLLLDGRYSIVRASSVEPDSAGGWSADLAACGGPILGSFSTRSAALEAEISWIEDNLL